MEDTVLEVGLSDKQIQQEVKPRAIFDTRSHRYFPYIMSNLGCNLDYS